MRKVKDAIPVYDICTLDGAGDHNADIIAEQFGNYLKVHPDLHLAHGHSFFHLVLFTKGSGYHNIDFNRFPVEPGQVYFMVPGQVHSWSFEDEVDGYVINFSDGLFQSFLKDSQYLEAFRFFSGNAKDQVIKLSNDALQNAEALFRQIVTEAGANDAFHLDNLQLLLLQFFILTARCDLREGDGVEWAHPSVVVLQNFRKLLNQYYNQYKLPKEYAAMLYVTPSYLNALCKTCSVNLLVM